MVSCPHSSGFRRGDPVTWSGNPIKFRVAIASALLLVPDEPEEGILTTVNVVWGDFSHGPRHSLRVCEGLVELAMSERRGFLRGSRSFRYGVADFETLRPASVSSRRRVGLAIATVLCLLPLGPFALLGLVMLALKREVATFWCALKDGRTFTAELPAEDYRKLSETLEHWRETQRSVVPLLPALRRGRGAAGRPALATVVVRSRPSEPQTVPWTPANDVTAPSADGAASAVVPLPPRLSR